MLGFTKPNINKVIQKILKEEKPEKVEDIIKLGQFYGISHKAMLYRLRNDGYLDAEEIKNMLIKNDFIEK